MTSLAYARHPGSVPGYDYKGKSHRRLSQPREGLLTATVADFHPGVHERDPDADKKELEAGLPAAGKWGQWSLPLKKLTTRTFATIG
jgi:hypothetical protein